MITDSSNAVPVGKIPGTGSRDWQNVSIVKDGDMTFCKVGEYLFQMEDSISSIYNGDAYCTVQTTGYARWYTIGEAAGETMAVTLPPNGQFYVYDENGVVVDSSIFGDAQAVLPDTGWISFIGDPGQVFDISMQDTAG